MFLMLSNRIDEKQIEKAFQHIYQPQNGLAWGIVLALMPLNWCVEALKWKKSLVSIQFVSFSTALKSVLFGLSVGSIGSFVGDFTGRIGILKTSEKLKSTGAALFGYFVQSVALLLTSTWATYYLLFNSKITLSDIHFLFFYALLIVSTLSLLFLFWEINWRTFLSEKIKTIFTIKYNFKDKNILLFLSLFRHLIFTLQYFFLLQIFEIRLPFLLSIAIITLVLLAKTAGAFLGFLGDISSRQLSAIYLFGLYNQPMENVLLATFVLWLINIFTPMFLGIFFVFQASFSTSAKTS